MRQSVLGMVVALCAVFAAQRASAILVVDDFQHTGTVVPAPILDPGGLTPPSGVFLSFGADYILKDRWDNTLGTTEPVNGPVNAKDTVPMNLNTAKPGNSPLKGILGGTRDLNAESTAGDDPDAPVTLKIDTSYDHDFQVPNSKQSFTLNTTQYGAAVFTSPVLEPMWRLIYDENGAGFNMGQGVDVLQNNGNAGLSIFFDFVNDGSDNTEVIVDLFDTMGNHSAQSKFFNQINPVGVGGVLFFGRDDFAGVMGPDADFTKIVRMDITFNANETGAADFVIERIEWDAPEPATFAMLGLAGLALLRRRRTA